MPLRREALNIIKLTLLLPYMISPSPFCFGSYGIMYNNEGDELSPPPAPAPEPLALPNGDSPNEALIQSEWQKACSTENGALDIPADYTYQLKPMKFSGPCNGHTTVMIYGRIEASDDTSDYEEDRRHWLLFQQVDNLRVEGGGTIDGNGHVWWQTSCKRSNSSSCEDEDAPTALTFRHCNNLTVDNLNMRNAQQVHIGFQDCNKVVASNLMIIAPGDSPNTDGIHVTKTTNIKITKNVIRTGDDCISIVSGSKRVLVTDISCGPGHGISIGSLGEGGSEAYVSDVLVNRARLSGTTNGVRIKTWQGGSGHAKNIQFQNIQMEDVKHPIIINQNYCDDHKSCPTEYSAVEVSKVYYRNIRGTSRTKTAITFQCSESIPCSGIMLQDVNLLHEGEEAEAECENVDLVNRGNVSPICS